MSALVELGSFPAELKATNPASPKLFPEEEQLQAVGFLEDLRKMLTHGSLNFEAWTSIISELEKSQPDNIEEISLVYDSFLSKFPLCHLYWKKYAYHKARLCTIEEAVEIFEQGVKSLTYSVSLWLEYCNFAISVCEDPSDVRRLFKRALVFIGKDYLCHSLWDRYMEYEFSLQQWSFLAYVYIQALRFPTKKLHSYYDNFKKLIGLMKEEIENHNGCEMLMEAVPVDVIKISESEISLVLKDLEDPFDYSHKSKALNKFMSIGEQFYRQSCLMDEKISSFETCIQRPFFHVKPVGDDELQSWHNYLDFIEKQYDFDWAVKLYERCLISCANYPEFWMRYVHYMETRGGRELANYSIERATKIHLKNVPEIHIFNAWFKEETGDMHGSRVSFLLCDAESDSHFIGNTMKKANAEKRMGNVEAAYDVFQKALERAVEEQRFLAIPLLYIHFCHLKFQVTGSSDAARDVLIDGISKVPYCKLLLEELIKFAMMHDGSTQVNKIDSIIATALYPGPNESPRFSNKDREDISTLYLEFVDLCGSIQDLLKAWNRHIKLFPKLMRNTFSYGHVFSSNHFMNIIKKQRERNIPAQPNLPSGSHPPDHMIQGPRKDTGEGLPEDNHIQATQDFIDEAQIRQDDKTVQEQEQVVSLPVDVQYGRDAPGAVDLVHQTESASIAMESTHDQVEAVSLTDGVQSGRDSSSADDLAHQSEIASVQMESSHYLEFLLEEGASKLLKSTHSIQKSIEDATVEDLNDEIEQVAQPIKPDSKNHSTKSTLQQGQIHEIARYSDSISLESLTLNSLETQALVPLSYDEKDKIKTSLSNGSLLEGSGNGGGNLSGPNRNLVTHSGYVDNDLVIPSSSEGHENSAPRETHPSSETLKCSEKNQHQMNDMLKTSEDTGSEFHGYSPGQQQMPQQQCLSQSCAQDLFLKDDERSQFHIGASKGIAGTSQSQSMESMTQHTLSLASKSQISTVPFSHSQAQLSDFVVPDSQQLEQSQHSNEYNQMLQYHYHQQQQFLQQQYQQQFLQMQQSYQQWQQIQSQQQQMPQQQHHPGYQEPGQQQVQSQQLQCQQSAQQLQPQEDQQQQQQYYQFYQYYQQGYQQQTEEGYQLQLQQYKLQQEQLYQQMMHQYQLHFQEEYWRLQQQQHGDQPSEEQKQPEQWPEQKHNASVHSPTQNRSYSEQGPSVQPSSHVGASGAS